MKSFDLSFEFPAITKAIAAMLSESVGPPPDMRSLGQRTYDSFQRNQNLDLIRPRDWRHVPYALWITKNTGLCSRSDVIERYLNKELPRSIAEIKRPLKWGRPLVFIYVEEFKVNDPLFRRLAGATKNFFNSPVLNNTSSIVNLTRELNLFDLIEGPKKTALSIVQSRRSIKDWISLHELWPGFATSPFAMAAFTALLTSSDEVRRSDDYIKLIFEWSSDEEGNLRYPGVRVKLIESLLMPWRDRDPSDSVKSRVMTFLLRHFGDPRIGKNLWVGVSQEAVQVFNGWIVGRTLDTFFKILRDTADSIWEHRQKFWMAYFKKGHIDEVWVVLGPSAAEALKRLSDTRHLKYANLLGSSANQSVLLIRIGSMIFCEWSHDGRLRAQRVNSSLAPSLYKSYYESNNLKFQSLDFNNEQLKDPGLVHFSSTTGGWQERARIFIQKHTGVKLSQTEVTR